MVFSSLEFLCVFLPVIFVLYSVIPGIRAKNGLLIAASLAFYAYGEPVYVLLMIVSALMNYLFARLVSDAGQGRKPALVLALICNLGILGVFKYTGFILRTVNKIAGTSIAVPAIALPIGISFFTFQALSYVIDVYQGKVDVQKNFLKVLLYISFFPQLIAGPIVRYRDIALEIDDRHASAEDVAEGLRRFICGLGKKVLIANTMGIAADHVFTTDMSLINAPLAWIGAVAYMLQIYYDFSGYSDMAIGLGRMFGFHFRENFLHPYGAVSIQDFWRKWHISLSTWFKEYLYIPLGGNRKGQGRAALNRIIVFFLCGLWHGANWTFVVWGLWHGFFLLLETYFPAIKKLPKFVGRLYTCLVVCVGFVIFRADTIGQGLGIIRAMFTGFHSSAASASLCMQQLTPMFLVMLVLAVIGAAPIQVLEDKLAQIKSRKVESVLYIGAFVLLIWCLIRLSGSTYNPFIYFRF